jgi:hypothetical protein
MFWIESLGADLALALAFRFNGSINAKNRKPEIINIFDLFILYNFYVIN